MYGIILILLFLLIISLINSYLLYLDESKSNQHGQTTLIDTSLLPQNIGFTNYTIFYNKNDLFNMCHVSKKDVSNKPFIDIIFQDLVNKVIKKYPNRTLVIADQKNSSTIDISPHTDTLTVLDGLTKLDK
jgi:hypothetical protein